MEISLYQYYLPFVQSFRTGSKSFHERKGLYLVLDHNKIRAYGEAAPLPGFSRESLTDVRKVLTEQRDIIFKHVVEYLESDHLIIPHPSVNLPSSLAFALDSLLVDYRARQMGKSFRELLFEHPLNKVPVNGTLPVGEPGKIMQKAHSLWDEGYRTLKVKVGSNIENELKLIKQLRKQLPDVRIRVDANQSWTFKEAERHLKLLEPYHIEYCEEPFTNPNPKTIQALQNTISIPLALDESLYDDNISLDEWIESDSARFFIIKPMMFGHFQKLFETFKRTRSHEYRIILTTTLESGIGRMVTANLASGFGDVNYAHGLATGMLFKEDVVRDTNCITSGYYTLHEGSGMGEIPNFNNQNITVERLDF